MIPLVHPTRSEITVAGIIGQTDSSSRIRGSTSSAIDPPGALCVVDLGGTREYLCDDHAQESVGVVMTDFAAAPALPDTSAVEVARDSYQAINDRDAAGLDNLITTHFHEDATVLSPPSLAYGGTVVGAKRLARMFTAVASSDTPLGPDALDVVSLTARRKLRGSPPRLRRACTWMRGGDRLGRTRAVVVRSRARP